MGLIENFLNVWVGISFVICIVVFLVLFFSEPDAILSLIVAFAVLYWLTFYLIPKYIGLSWSVVLVSSFINFIFMLFIFSMKKKDK